MNGTRTRRRERKRGGEEKLLSKPGTYVGKVGWLLRLGRVLILVGMDGIAWVWGLIRFFFVSILVSVAAAATAHAPTCLLPQAQFHT